MDLGWGVQAKAAAVHRGGMESANICRNVFKATAAATATTAEQHYPAEQPTAAWLPSEGQITTRFSVYGFESHEMGQLKCYHCL